LPCGRERRPLDWLGARSRCGMLKAPSVPRGLSNGRVDLGSAIRPLALAATGQKGNVEFRKAGRHFL